ncbi:MAG: DUF2202 domain-containing protein [Proteobacteria bacterium]|nr:DUF2202 domain-containing protein [Pseudomonadota bacterium]
MEAVVSSLPFQSLNDEEKQGMRFMIEEEKLARDVYLVLYDQWKIPAFSNIAQSEQQHMNAIRALLTKYELPDPTAGAERGEFKDADLKALYLKLVQSGRQSEAAALHVGATIEDLDIRDLQENIKKTDNQDIRTVYQNLTKGSRNHLRAFNGQIQARGLTYQAQYITADELSEILNAPGERGMINDQGQASPAGSGQGRMNKSGAGRGGGGNR